MAMSATELANELKAMPLFDNEADAAQAWAEAFGNYFEGDGSTHGAESNSVYVASALMATAKLAMQGSLAGMSSPGQGAAKIQAGIQSFWSILVALPASAWATVTVITPPASLSGLAAALQPVFDNNRDSELSKDDAMTAIANAIHANNQGGSATWSGPTVLPIT